MAQVARYQPQRLFADHEAVKTFHGLDPLTGLPVLIYRFAGRPSVKVGELKSEAIPTILTSSFERGNFGGTFERGRGQLVVAYARGYEPLNEAVRPHEVVGLLRDSATALYDAARASVVHGDLRPERFLKANDHVMVEGYGVPWSIWDAASEFSAPERIGGASAKSDVFSWAQSVRFLAGPYLPREFGDLVAACLDADPKNRPSAETIYKQILEPDEVIEEPPAPTSSPVSLPPSSFDNLDFASDEEEEFAKNPFANSLTQGGQREGRGAPPSASSSGEPRRGAGRERIRRGATATRTEVRGEKDEPLEAPLDLPFDFGNDPNERSRLGKSARGRRTFLLIALLIGILILGALALFNRSSLSAAASTEFIAELSTGVGAALGALTSIFTGDTARSGTYLINVEVVPANVEAELFVVESPAGSDLSAEQLVSVVPGSAVLDRTGVWRLQAQVGERRSEIREVRVPDERSVTFTLPWLNAPAGQGGE